MLNRKDYLIIIFAVFVSIVGTFSISSWYMKEQVKSNMEIRALLKDEIQFVYPRVSEDFDSLYVDISMLLNCGTEYKEIDRVTIGMPVILIKESEE